MHVECVCLVIQSCRCDSQGDTCSVVHAAKRHNNVRLFWAVLLCTVPFFLSVMCVAPFIHFPSSCSSSVRITGGSNYYFLFAVVAVAFVCTKVRSRRAALRNIAALSEKALCSVASFFFFSLHENVEALWVRCTCTGLGGGIHGATGAGADTDVPHN